MGIASLIGVEKEGDAAYMVWLYVEGEPLGSTAGMERKLIRAVEALHGLGLVHGAIHAGNVIVRDGAVYLIDVSPLLFTDPRDDIVALGKLIGRTTRLGATLRDLELAEVPEGVEDVEKETSLRIGALIGAAVVALAGAGVAFLIWHYA